MDEFKTIAQYIAERYKSAIKIVEVGAGRTTSLAAEVKRLLPDSRVVIVDLEKPPIMPSGVEFFKDDLMNPNLEIYEEADLIYSFRPPFELYGHLLDVARKVGADLLLKPVTDERVPEEGKLVNYRGIPFYKFK